VEGDYLVRTIKQAVILAGGLGTRLKPFTNDNPKPMFEIEDKPFLEHLIMQIKEFGIRKIVILLGYLPEKIMNHFGNGKKLGLEIEYLITPVQYDTGKRIFHAKDKLDDEFLLAYSDNYCPLDFNKMVKQYFESDSLIQITAYSNEDNYSKNNVQIHDDNKIIQYDKKRTKDNLNAVDIGYALVNKEALNNLDAENVNFESKVYTELTNRGLLSGYLTNHRYYSIGNWDRIQIAKEFFKPKKAILLDRDGTLNKKAPKAQYITNENEFIWLDGAKEAIKKLKDRGYLIFLISNQAGIARGALNLTDLDKIHKKMNSDLSEIGANVDKIYFCPHNWDEDCYCRKPKPGMLYDAQKEWGLDLTKTFFIGDDVRDIEAGEKASCKTILVDENYRLIDAINEQI
jgi:histidinol-phosphate phosphatase family protein